MKTKGWGSRTRDELIIEVWEKLDCESVGARELDAIQQEVRETLGTGAVVSPATIARTLADEGAVLRHPEVLNCDAKWREANLAEPIALDVLNFSGLDAASISMQNLDERRRALEQNGDEDQLRRLREFVLQSKAELQRVARSKIVDGKDRSEAREVAEWLTIWLREPAIFSDWLVLRKKSPAFRKLKERN